MEFYDFFKSFISGGVAGMACLITGHPFDTIKVRLQAMPHRQHQHLYQYPFHCHQKTLSGAHYFTGAFDCLQKTVINEGFKALFKVFNNMFDSSSFTHFTNYRYTMKYHLFCSFRE